MTMNWFRLRIMDTTPPGFTTEATWAASRSVNASSSA